VDAAHDRFEVLDVEGVGPEMSVPADHVQRVMAVKKAVDLAACLDAHLEFPGLVDRH